MPVFFAPVVNENRIASQLIVGKAVHFQSELTHMPELDFMMPRVLREPRLEMRHGIEHAG